MNKKSLYSVIVFLVIVIVLLWAMLLLKQSVRTPEDISTDNTVEAVRPNEQEAQTESIDESEARIQINGAFVGFAEGEDSEQGSFKYMLINDGTEVQQIDLRPLVGYKTTNLEEELGIAVGEQVVATGYLEADVFVITDIR